MRPTPFLRRTALLLAAGLAAPAAADDGGWSFGGFAQLTAEHRESGDGIDFGADRIRAAGTYRGDPWFAGLVLDFNVPQAGDRTPGTLTNVIKDAYAGWLLSEHWQVKLGQFKAPVGMDFNVPGTQLDITKRAMEKPLVLERALGAMLSARDLPAGFGLDLALLNPAGRSGATAHTADQEGDSNAWAMRGHWDGAGIHAEASYGGSDEAGGVGTADYRVWDVGVRGALGDWSAKFEWVQGQNLLGEEGRDEAVGYAQLAWQATPAIQGLVRHYQGRSDPAAGPASRLGNTWLGVNLWPAPTAAAQLRVQINYVLASGDRDQYTGLGGFTGDAVLLQLQVASR